MKAIRAIIIDDEPMARQLLQGILDEHCAEITLIDLCSNLPEGVKSIHKNAPDLVFLDIEMPGHSGLELLDFFNPQDVHFSIIFTTAYNQYAVKAFKLSAIDYILKPIDPESVVEAVQRYRHQQDRRTNYSVLKENLSIDQTNKKLAIHGVNTIHFIPLDTISYFKADGSYTHVVLTNGTKILSSRSLKHFEQTLEEQVSFMRCHKSFIVNLNDISAYLKTDGGSLIMNQKDEVSISQDRVKDVLTMLKV